MNLDPLTNASFAIQLHVVAAIAALLLGAVVLFGGKGTRLHRVGGLAWVGLMLTVALSSFFISAIGQVGPFSWIHLLSVATLFYLAVGIRHARNGRIRRHRQTMRWLYVGALIITGAFTFLPGRIMHATFIKPLVIAVAP